MAIQPKLSRLKSQLASSKVKEEDFPLFQVISQLIDIIKQLQDATLETITTTSGTSSAGLNAVKNSDLVTHTDESILLPNSRMLVAGDDISFDTSVANQLEINALIESGYWAPLTDGDLDETDLIFANGECVMVFVPV